MILNILEEERPAFRHTNSSRVLVIKILGSRWIDDQNCCAEDDATQPELTRHRSQFRRQPVAVEPGDEQLTNLTAKRERRHEALKF